MADASHSFRRPVAQQVLVTAAAFVVVIAGVRAAEAIVTPFLVAVFIAVTSAPPVFWLERRGYPAVVAVVTVMLALAGLLVGLGTLIGTSINSFTRAIPTYEQRFREEVAQIAEWMQGWGVDISGTVFTDYLDAGAIMGLLARTLTNLGGVLTNTFLILLTVIFILLEASTLPDKLRATMTDPVISMGRLTKITEDIQRYLAIKSWVSLATGLFIGTWTALFGLDFPLIWGLLAFLLNYVPTLGSMIAGVPAVMLAFIQLGLLEAVLIAAGYVVVNVSFGNFIEPRLLGRRLGLSTLVVFLSLVFWGWVLGPVGMLLSVPLTMTLKIALESSDDARWLVILLGRGNEVGQTQVAQESDIPHPSADLLPNKGP